MRVGVVLWILILAVMLISGCIVVEQPSQQCCQPQQSQQCWLTVTSASPDVWGYVWVDGKNTGVYLLCLSSVTIPVRCGPVVVQVIDEYGVASHTEIGYPRIGYPAEVVFYYW